MIIKFNDNVLKVGDYWCNGDSIPPLYEDPTILYPKNTSDVSSLGLADLPAITQRYGVVSFDNKPYIPDNAVTYSTIELRKHGIQTFMAYNWGAVRSSTGNWERHISFAAAYDGDRFTTRFATFVPVDNVGTTMTLYGIGGQVIFKCYENYNLYRNNEYTHFKLIFDRNTNIVYIYLNNVYMGYGTIVSPFHEDEFLRWYSGTTSDRSYIYGNSLKNVEIVSFSDFNSAVAYT